MLARVKGVKGGKGDGRIWGKWDDCILLGIATTGQGSGVCTPRHDAKGSNQDRAGLLGIYCRTASQRRDPAEFLVSRDKHSNLPQLLQIEGHG